jgi:hypothetical protein
LRYNRAFFPHRLSRSATIIIVPTAPTTEVETVDLRIGSCRLVAP